MLSDVTFEPGEFSVPKCLRITILDDLIVEGTKSFEAHLSLSVSPEQRHLVTLGESTTTVVILDDDTVAVSLLTSELTVAEERGYAEVCAEMEGAFDTSAKLEMALHLTPHTATGLYHGTHTHNYPEPDFRH